MGDVCLALPLHELGGPIPRELKVWRLLPIRGKESLDLGDVFMSTARQHPRISDTRDLLANLRPFGRSARAGRVLNLSHGGMLVAGNDLKVGEKTAFELMGPSFHYAGVAEVAHLTTGATGLRFLTWQGQAGRPVRSLVDERTEWTVTNAAPRPKQPVVRRVAVLVGPQRPTRRDA